MVKTQIQYLFSAWKIVGYQNFGNYNGRPIVAPTEPIFISFNPEFQMNESENNELVFIMFKP